MNKYYFETTVTMKEYNSKKYWIDSVIVRPVIIEAETLKNAMCQFLEILAEKYYISVSDNALKHKKPMYIDTPNGTKQVGFVITGKTEFETNYAWSAQYIDLWVNIALLSDLDFEGA